MMAKFTRLASQNSNATAPSGRELIICSSHSRQPVQKLLDTPSYLHVLTTYGPKPTCKCKETSAMNSVNWHQYHCVCLW